MTKIDKWSQFVAQLIERTQDKRILWTSYKPKPSEGAIQIDVVYQTKYQDKALRLYETILRKGIGEVIWFGGPRLREEVVLIVVDDQQNELFRFPESPALRDLLKAVKYQVARIDDFLDGLLQQ